MFDRLIKHYRKHKGAIHILGGAGAGLTAGFLLDKYLGGNKNKITTSAAGLQYGISLAKAYNEKNNIAEY